MPPLFPCVHSLMNLSRPSFCSHQDYPSLPMWNGPDIWYAPTLTNPSETSWDQRYVTFMRSWMSYVSISSWLCPHITSILIKQCLIFLHPSAPLILEPTDPIGLTCTVMNKTSRSSRAHLLKALHWNPAILLLKPSHFILFINTCVSLLCEPPPWKPLSESLKYPRS